jgi:hypothetical protein
MDSSEIDNRYATIDAKLATVLESLPEPPSWFPRLQSLDGRSSDEERLEVYQAIRDSGIIPENAGFYLVSLPVDEISERHAEIALVDLETRLRAIEAAHGLGEDESWETGEAPDEYDDILEQYEQASDEIFAGLLLAHGEEEIAELFRTDRAEYDRRHDEGRQFFFPPDPESDGLPFWLNELFDAIAEGLTPDSLMGPLGFRWLEEEGFWEIDAYPTPVELVGGAADGAVVAPGFTLDLERLRAAFDQIDDLGWNALGWPDGDGPFVWVEGAFQGHSVFLRILAEAPEGEEPGAKLRVPKKGDG